MSRHSLRAALFVSASVVIASSVAVAQSKAPTKAPAAAAAAPGDAISAGDNVAYDLDAALAAYLEGLRREPQNAALHYRVGQVQVIKGDLKAAEAAYLDGLRTVKDAGLRARLLFVVADLRERQKDHDAALAAWTKYEEAAKAKSDAKFYPQTAQQRKKRITEYKRLLSDYAAVKARIEKRLQEADQRARKNAGS